MNQFPHVLCFNPRVSRSLVWVCEAASLGLSCFQGGEELRVLPWVLP